MSFIPYERAQVRANIQVKGTSHGPHEYNAREGYRRPRAVLLHPWGEDGGESGSQHRMWRATDLTQTNEVLVQELVWLDRAPAGELIALPRVVGVFRGDDVSGTEAEAEEVEVDFTIRTQQCTGGATAWTTITSETITQVINIYPMRSYASARILRFAASVHIAGNYDFANIATALAPVSYEGQLVRADFELFNALNLAVPLTGVDPAHPVRVQVLTSGDPALSVSGRSKPGALAAACSLYWRST